MNTSFRTPGSNRGFTLIELLVTVVIVGILASVAFPSYLEHVAKARRADAKGVMMELAQGLERLYSENNGYRLADGSKPVVGSEEGVFFTDKVPLQGSERHYTLTLVLDDADTTVFGITAEPKNAQSDDKCGSLTLNQAGTRGVTGAHSGITAEDCW